MAKKVSALADTDIFIDYFNHQLFKEFFESGQFIVYYSVVTKKELLSKEGLTDAEQKTIRKFLKHCRLIPLDHLILRKYSDLSQKHPAGAKEDRLIAATAIVKKFPLLTRNFKHYRIFKELILYFQD